jgi:hypothetical protein
VRAAAAAFPPAALALSAVTVGTGALAARATRAVTAIGAMAVGVAAPLLFAAVTLRVAPYAGTSAWKTPATALLLVLPAVASACAIVKGQGVRGPRRRARRRGGRARRRVRDVHPTPWYVVH